jgi:hypothetical protein
MRHAEDLPPQETDLGQANANGNRLDESDTIQFAFFLLISPIRTRSYDPFLPKILQGGRRILHFCNHFRDLSRDFFTHSLSFIH